MISSVWMAAMTFAVLAGVQAQPPMTVVDEVRARLSSLVVDAGPIRVEPNIDCGIHAMAAIHLAMGDAVDWVALRRELAPQRTGSSMQQIAAYARGQGLHVLAVELRSADLPRLRHPAILHVRKGGEPTGGPNHFLVTLPSPEDGVVVFDPPRHLEAIAPEALEPVWAGHALVIAREPIEADAVLASGMPVTAAMAGAAGVGALAMGVAAWRRRWCGAARRGPTRAAA